MAESESEALDRARRELADALARVEHDLPSETEPSAPIPPPPAAPPPVQPPASAAEFRRPSRPDAPPSRPAAPPSRPAAPSPSPAPAQPSPAAAKPKPARPQRPDRPDRPEAPPSTVWSEDEAAEVAAHYDPMSEIIDDDDAVIVPAPEPEVFAPHAPKVPTGPGGIRSLAFRRTVIPILLTCGVLLIGIGSLRWLGGPDSIFVDMSIPLSAALCGCGFFLFLVAVLNMLQVKGELAAAAKRSA
jgi:hypothetical protein